MRRHLRTDRREALRRKRSEMGRDGDSVKVLERLARSQLAEHIREAVYQRANYRCEDCGGIGDWRGLAIHHVEHLGMGGASGERGDRLNSAENLVLLCARCHSRAHGVTET